MHFCQGYQEAMLSPSRCEEDTMGVFEEDCPFVLGREALTVQVLALQTGILLYFLIF